jgi:Protein of unknown function (DUF4011)/REase_MTES_1575/AAA domain/Transcription elongation factor, GreA/GreB, C-term
VYILCESLHGEKGGLLSLHEHGDGNTSSSRDTGTGGIHEEAENGSAEGVGEEIFDDIFGGQLSTAVGLERIRKRLLDLTRSNPLLNYRFPKKRCLRIVDSSLEGIFSRVFDDGRGCVLIAVPEPAIHEYEGNNGSPRKPDVKAFAESRGINTDYELPLRAGQGNCSHLQTLHYADDLEGLLRKIDQIARTAVEESGINMLYLVLGYLEWYESVDSDKPLLAPLLILPVSIKREGVERTTGFFQYSLEHTGEDLTENITLREKMKREFNLELPEFEEEDTPGSYFAKIAEFVKPRPRWKLRRNACICLLSFGRLLMYLDLDPARWPDRSPLHKHPIISSFFEGIDRNEAPGIAQEYRIDDEESFKDIPIVYDADSSQHSALVDAIKGKNLVIEGPPGTGKSQTITNLIAAALIEGKTVLFVSEKLAALEVVRRNLERVNLSDFCLALHSHKTQKKKLLEDIGQRIEKNFRPPDELEAKIRELAETRDKLKNYAYLINSTRDNRMGLTLHQVLWRSERYRSLLNKKEPSVPPLELLDTHEVNTEKFAQLEQAVLQFTHHLKEIGCYGSDHPWYGYYPSQLMFGDDVRVESILRNLQEVAGQLHACTCSAETKFGIASLRTHESVKKIYEHVTYGFPPISGKEAFDLLPHICSSDAVHTVRALDIKLAYIRQHEEALKRDLTAPDAISEEELNKARLMLGYAKTIGQDKSLISDIVAKRSSLEDLSEKIKNATSFFLGVAEKIGVKWDMTLTTVDSLIAAIRCAASAPFELLPLRNPALLEPSAKTIAQEARKEAESLRSTRAMLQESFELSVLPSNEELSRAVRAFRAGGGIFRFLKKEWREAKKLYRGISHAKKGRIQAEECAEELLSIISYREAKSSFESNKFYRRLAGEAFRGINTEFDKIEQLLTWYELVQQEFRECSNEGYCIQCSEVLTLSYDALQFLSAKNEEGKRLFEIFSSIPFAVTSVFSEDSLPEGLREWRRLDELCNELLQIGSMMKEIGAYFRERFQIPITPIAAIDTMASAVEVHKRKTEITADTRASRLLGKHFKELDTDLSAVRAVIDWGRRVDGTGLPAPLKNWLLVPEAPARLEEVRTSIYNIYHNWQSVENLNTDLRNFGKLDCSQWYCSDTITPEIIIAKVNTALNALHMLMQWADFSRAVAQMMDVQLGQLCEVAFTGSLPADELHAYFNYSFYSSLAKNIMRKNPQLMVFSGVTHDQVRKRYVELDQEVIKLNGSKSAHTISKRYVPYGNSRGPVKTYTDKALILHELGKKSRHIPIRQLIRRGGSALQALKPCFMMGPLSVSQYLIPGALEFDMIIMDEASQLKPEDALGAVARGKQIVVVGDPKQLPPTSFFDRVLNDMPAEDEDSEAAIDSAESILDISQFLFQPVRRLRWHYRSRHESLIAFSNTQFYDNHLVLFPSPHGPKSGLGVRYNYVKNALYVNRRNRLEAERVADAVIEHFERNPEESLGVVTLNLTQRDLIEEEIDNRLKRCEGVMNYLTKWEEESYPFFIKNLENVQGDERDVIFISTTFGRGPEGVLRMHFGPINRNMGWRRLNVLFTRARKRVEVFTSMEPEDIRIEPNAPRGVKALKDYLSFAKSGELESPRFTEREPDSDFEIAVAEVLKNRGYEVVPQLGVAGFFIDIAVRNPERPGDFLACVECDGATYHSGLSVRDRDRLRQQVLERLGWKGKIHRIWSSDWFKDPLVQTRKLLDFLEQLRIKAKQEPLWAEEEAVKKVKQKTCVEVGDCVTYCDTSSPDVYKKVQIVNGHADPKMGLIGESAPLAKALLGADADEEVELAVPGSGEKILRIIEISKPSDQDE